MKAFSPETLEEALRLFDADPELRLVAGCTDLMVTTPEDRAALPGVLDLLRLGDLRGICGESGDPKEGQPIHIGATTTFSEIGDSPLIQRHFPALVAAARSVGGWQIQNRATVGGNIANASPAGDSLPVLLALDATVVLASAGGERRIPYRDFHTGYRETALQAGELILRLELPIPPQGSRQGFRKVGTREAQAISKVVVAGFARVEGGRFAEIRFAAGSVAATPVRLTAVEEALLGQPVGAGSAEKGGEVAASSVKPIDDVRSTADYRRFALGRVVRRMLLEFADP